MMDKETMLEELTLTRLMLFDGGIKIYTKYHLSKFRPRV
jgi:hypothetical protein